MKLSKATLLLIATAVVFEVVAASDTQDESKKLHLGSENGLLSPSLRGLLEDDPSYKQTAAPPGMVHDGDDRFPGWKGRDGYNHHNDGDEGDEGNEGNEGNEGGNPPDAEYKQTAAPPGMVHDGDDRFPGWKGRDGYNHPNDGDEGNEGGEEGAPLPTVSPVPPPTQPPAATSTSPATYVDEDDEIGNGTPPVALPATPPAAAPAPTASPDPAAAPVPELDSTLTTDELMSNYFAVPDGECPGLTTTPIGAGEARPYYPIKPIAESYYEDNKQHRNKPGTHIFMKFPPVESGDTYCYKPEYKEPKIAYGGTVFFKKNGRCYHAPTKADGSPCCTMKFWQPDHEGYYYNDCSASVPVTSSGYWVYSVMPFDESERWGGPDPMPHVHYDIRCSGCKVGAFRGDLDTSMGEGWWNKWYPLDRCLDTCGKTGPQHEAERSSIRGIPTYRYNMIIPID